MPEGNKSCTLSSFIYSIQDGAESLTILYTGLLNMRSEIDFWLIHSIMKEIFFIYYTSKDELQNGELDIQPDAILIQ